MLLSTGENRDEKKDKSPEEWLKDKDEDYFKIHLIPIEDRDLWKIENFEKFTKERENLIINEFKKRGLVA